MIPTSATITYPFADTVSPHASWLEEQTRTWLYQFYPGLPQDIKEKYKHTATGYLTARFFPFASPARLLPLAQSSLWGLAFDDFYEHSTPSVYKALSRRLTAIIKGKSKPYKKENEFFWQMYEMANDFRKFMPPFWMDRFAHSMALYFEGMAEEAPFKATLQFPSIEQYMAIRWKSVDVLQMIDGLEVATEMPLPDAVRHHPHMEQIAWLTCRIIAWCNDYFSAAKEQGLDVMNLILICQHQYHLSLDAAVQEAVRLHNEDVNTYLELCQSLPDHLKDDPAVQKFLSYNNYMIAGHWRWYITDTQRYRPGGYPTDQFHQNK